MGFTRQGHFAPALFFIKIRLPQKTDLLFWYNNFNPLPLLTCRWSSLLRAKSFDRAPVLYTINVRPNIRWTFYFAATYMTFPI